MFEIDKIETCTKCGSEYKLSLDNESFHVPTRFDGLCENCCAELKQKSLDEALAKTSAKMMVAHKRTQKRKTS